MLIETDIFYRRTYECYALSDIEYVKGARRGVNQGGMNTIHFVLYAGLKDKIKLIKILDSTSEFRVKKSLLAVRQFLNQDLHLPLEIVDEAVSKMQRTKKEQYKYEKRKIIVPKKIYE